MNTPSNVKNTMNPQKNSSDPSVGFPDVGSKYPNTPIDPIATASTIIPVGADLPVHIAASIMMKMNGIGTPIKSPNWLVNAVNANVPLPCPKLVNARI